MIIITKDVQTYKEALMGILWTLDSFIQNFQWMVTRSRLDVHINPNNIKLR